MTVGACPDSAVISNKISSTNTSDRRYAKTCGVKDCSEGEGDEL
jgi:hypothetical protein